MDTRKPGKYSKKERDIVKKELLKLLEVYLAHESVLGHEEAPKKLQEAKEAFEKAVQSLGVPGREPEEIIRNYIPRVIWEKMDLSLPSSEATGPTGRIFSTVPLGKIRGKIYYISDLLDLMGKEFECLDYMSDESIRRRIEQRKQKAMKNSNGDTKRFLEEFYETIPNEFDKHPFAERLHRSDPYNQIPKFLALYKELTGDKISEIDLKRRFEEIILTVMGPNIAADAVKYLTFYEVMQYMKAQLNRRKIEQQGLQKQKGAKKISDSERQSTAIAYVVEKKGRGEVPTQQKIAEHVGVSRRTIIRRLRGDPPKWDQLAGVLKAANTPDRIIPSGENGRTEEGLQSLEAWDEEDLEKY